MNDVLRLVPAFLLLVLSLACGSDQKPEAQNTVVPLNPSLPDTVTLPSGAGDSLAPTSPEDTVITTLLAAGQQFGTTEHEIRRILGAPDSVNATPFQNQHDSAQIDTILRLYYHDLTFGLYRVSKAPRDILLQVILAGAERRLPFGIGVGTHREQLAAILGPTREGSDDAGLDTLEYQGPMENPGMIRFLLRKHRVQRIEWSYFID